MAKSLNQRMKDAIKPEVEVMPVAVAKTTIAAEIGKVSRANTELSSAVMVLRITDSESYLEADSLLGRVRAARQGWGAVWAKIQEKTIKPIREGLDQLYETNREVDGPLEKMERHIKDKQAEYKQLEARKLQEAEEAKQAEIRRLQAIEETNRRKAETAKTEAMRKQLIKAAEAAATAAIETEQEKTPEPIKVANSTTRTVPTPKVKNALKFYAAVANGDIPADCVMILESKLKDYYKDYPDDVKGWPGVVIEDVVSIIGR